MAQIDEREQSSDFSHETAVGSPQNLRAIVLTETAILGLLCVLLAIAIVAYSWLFSRSVSIPHVAGGALLLYLVSRPAWYYFDRDFRQGQRSHLLAVVTKGLCVSWLIATVVIAAGCLAFAFPFALEGWDQLVLIPVGTFVLCLMLLPLECFMVHDMRKTRSRDERLRAEPAADLPAAPESQEDAELLPAKGYRDGSR